MPGEILHNEKELLQQLAEGHEPAFRTLYDHYWKRIYTQALTYMQSSQYASDIVQEVFSKVWIKRAHLAEINNFPVFIYVITRNIIVSDLRKKVFHSYLDAEHNNIQEEALLPDVQITLKEAKRLIQEAVDQLPPQQRTAYTLSRNQGLSYEHIARQMKLSPLTVKVHISKAIQAIRQHFHKHNGSAGLLLFLLLYGPQDKNIF